MPERRQYDLASLIDVERYPIGQLGSAAYNAVVASACAELDSRNCAQLPDFIMPAALVEMQSEAAKLSPQATYTQAWLNPYFSDPPDDAGSDHPLRRFSLRRHGMVRGDRFSRQGAIWSVFQSPELCRFVADCLGYGELHPYADPYGCVNVNVQPPGCEFAWHFDHNDFTVSIGLKQPAAGGAFEYASDIRSEHSENYGAVQSVLDGDCSQVHTLFLRPGDLQLFRGGYTLHRVTAPENEERHSLLLSYVKDPSHIATPEYAQRLWGEVHPLHRQSSATHAS